MEKDGIAMGSPLGRVFMAEFEQNFILELSLKMATCKCYVDYRIAYVKAAAIDYVLPVLNSFHTKIKFTYEIEDSSEIAFLDALLVRKGTDIETNAYRNPRHNVMYLHWNSFAPESWKQGII